MLVRDPKVKSHIRIGDKVVITRFPGDDSHTLKGIVTKILESENYNKNGVEVSIDTGFDGHVLKISDDWPTEEELQKMIEGHETEFFELKESFNINTKNTNQHIDLKKVLAQEIVAFLNSKKGGYLCLGVSDEPKIVGLKPDYDEIKESNLQEWVKKERPITKELLRDRLKLNINDGIRKFIYGHPETFDLNMKFYDLEGNDVCLIKLDPRKTPVYVAPTKDYQAVEFRVRVGTTKKSLNIPDSVQYIQDNFDQGASTDKIIDV